MNCVCTVYCVLYTVYCILCTVYCVLYTVYCVLCTVYCVLCTVYCIPCTMYRVLCTVHCVLVVIGLRVQFVFLNIIKSNHIFFCRKHNNKLNTIQKQRYNWNFSCEWWLQFCIKVYLFLFFANFLDCIFNSDNLISLIKVCDSILTPRTRKVTPDGMSLRYADTSLSDLLGSKSLRFTVNASATQ